MSLNRDTYIVSKIKYFESNLRILKPAIKELDLDPDIALHTFRHTSVYLSVQSGADILSISKRLGHSKISMTADTYSELFEDIDEKLVEGLEQLQADVV